MPITLAPDVNTPSIIINSQAVYLPTSPGTIPLTLSLGVRNRIINGKMDVSQRAATFAGFGVGQAYSTDRWQWEQVNAGAVSTVTQQADAPSNEFQNSLRVTVTTADAAVATNDLTHIMQKIEGVNVRDLIGRTFTISFWVKSSKIGIHCIALRNSGLDRAYIAEYSVINANTWEYKTITIAGGFPSSGGTWNWGTGVGVIVSFVMQCGTTFTTTPNAWQTGNLLGTANQVNVLDTIGNIFAVTGVQLELGGTATTFEHRPFGLELSMCQRYFFHDQPGANNPYSVGTVWTTNTAYTVYTHPVPMRVTPTLSFSAAGDFVHLSGGTTPVASTISVGQQGPLRSEIILTTPTASLVAGQGCWLRANNANSWLRGSAEL